MPFKIFKAHPHKNNNKSSKAIWRAKINLAVILYKRIMSHNKSKTTSVPIPSKCRETKK